jgi:hypothetical protein
MRDLLGAEQIAYVIGDARDEKAISVAVAGQDAVFTTIGTQTLGRVLAWSRPPAARSIKRSATMAFVV